MTVKIKVESNADVLMALITRAARYLDSATATDPVAQKMADFGPIDLQKHVNFTTRITDGVCYVDVSLCDDLQKILDLVPAP